MQIHEYLVIAAILFTSGQTLAVDTDKQMYARCAACHGVAGEGSSAMSAPRLAGQSRDYLSTQLKAYQRGTRGYHGEDELGRAMRATVASLSAENIELLAAYASNLRGTTASLTRGNGDAVAGKQTYEENCGQCHGLYAKGIPVFGAPNLAILDYRYIQAQIATYRAGWRGDGDIAEPRAKWMRTMASQINERELQDIGSYLETIR